MSRRRVLHLITRLPIGGAERMLLGVLHNLDATRFDSVVCCIQDRGELADEVESLGISVHALGLMARGGFDRRVVPALRRLILEQKVELVHSHLYHANLYGRLAAWCEGIPIIASVHNTYTRRKWHRHLINRLLARLTFRITAGSADVERDIISQDHVAPGKVVRLPNCIDLDRVATSLSSAVAKQRLGFDPADMVIATVGRMEEQKGHAFLLEAFASLRQIPELEGISLRLLMVGDGRLRAATEQRAADLNIAGICRFVGSIKDLADVYCAMDVFVMPSLWEGLSLAMLEAMAAGLPMIATDVGGARDVLGDSLRGILVPAADASALVRAIHGLLLDAEKRGVMADAGSRHVRENYSVSALSRQLAELYDAALQNSDRNTHGKT
jgi:glycosyltransferase involved in cell wall biosynthesis